MVADLLAALGSFGPLILRVALGTIFLFHGWPKLNPNSPMKGTAGLSAGLKQIGVPLPALFAWVVALVETAGAVLLILGVATRLVALLLAADMLVAGWARATKWNARFTSPQGPGWEFEFALLAAALSLAFTGGGSLALLPALG